MFRPIDRRAVLALVGTMALAVTAGAVAAQPPEITGSVTFELGLKIPEGQLEIYLETRATNDSPHTRAAATRVVSNGGSQQVRFSLSPPESLEDPANARVVALLERADGWLLARGSATVEAGSPVDVTLHTAMY